ncbi:MULTISPECIES: hypothetical protein [unclassified Variovorax]|uniref:hypothetical protein n=1 Tax=unclassified Variovorax TaxID=663243 RepID=UPI0013A5A104|nr:MULTISPECIES: hypothetical protein [unclassified Variovorax]
MSTISACKNSFEVVVIDLVDVVIIIAVVIVVIVVVIPAAADHPSNPEWRNFVGSLEAPFQFHQLSC